jgi:hypothetical protein
LMGTAPNITVGVQYYIPAAFDFAMMVVDGGTPLSSAFPVTDTTAASISWIGWLVVDPSFSVGTPDVSENRPRVSPPSAGTATVCYEWKREV